MKYNHYIEAGEAEPQKFRNFTYFKPFMVNKCKHLYTMKYNIILYTGENGVVGSAPQGRHGTTKTFIYLEVQYNIEDTKHW